MSYIRGLINECQMPIIYKFIALPLTAGIMRLHNLHVLSKDFCFNFSIMIKFLPLSGEA